VIRPLLGHRSADIARGVTNHPGHPLLGGKLGGDDGITLVFAILVVSDKHGLALTKGLKDLFEIAIDNLCQLLVLHKSFDVLGQNIGLNIHLVSRFLVAQGCDGQGFWNQREPDNVSVNFINGQRDAIKGD
jgi:hypothetical protein